MQRAGARDGEMIGRKFVSARRPVACWAMSRAFVRESDHSDDDPPINRQQLPLGIKNLITPAGAQRLQAQLADLLETKRWLSFSTVGVISPEDETEKRKLQTRIRLLQQ